MQCKSETDIALADQVRLVKFGYDVKDSFPSTYAFNLIMSSLTLDLVAPSGLLLDATLMDRCNNKKITTRMKCHEFNFSMERTPEWVSRQKVTLMTMHLMTSFCDASYRRTCRNAYDMIDLIVPLSAEEDADGSALDPHPSLVYTSTSNPHLDNAKTLTLSSDCVIDFSNPFSWFSLKKFFSDLPSPVIWNTAEVLGTIRIEDRWYSIDHTIKGLPMTVEDEAPRQQRYNDSPFPISGERCINSQIRLIFCRPRLLLGVVKHQNGEKMNHNVVIRLDLDYLYTFEKSTAKSDALHSLIVKNVWVHTNYSFISKAALCTSSLPWAPSIAGTLLLNSANVALTLKSGPKPFSELLMCASIYIGFVVVNLPYSGIGTVLEVVDHFMKNMKASSERDTVGTHERMNFDVMMYIAGLSLLSVDDSCRHFGQVQDLVQLRLGEMNLSCKNDQLSSPESSASKISSVFQLQSLHVIDCLQDVKSSFRISLTSTSTPDEILNGSCSAALNLEKYEAYPVDFDLIMFFNAPGGLGFIAYDTDDIFKNMCPPRKNFLEVKNENIGIDFSSFVVSVGSLVMQWNPSTVIAVQRFLGRAYKDFLKWFPNEPERISDGTVLPSQMISWNGSQPGHVNRMEHPPFKAALHLETLSVILNKEHQERHLLSISISGLAIHYTKDSLRKLEMFGSVTDLRAVDLQQYSPPPGLSINEENLTLLSVDRHDDNSLCLSSSVLPLVKGDRQFSDTVVRQDFVTFHFRKSKTTDEIISLSSADVGIPLSEADLPSWVLSAGHVDDFLSATMSSLMFVYLSDRTAELVDYLSNGLPGKGMGRTAAAAKGFFGARIKTRSAMSILVETPVIKIPRHLFSNSFVKVRLGDVQIKSWFEELTFTSALMTRAKDIQGIPTHSYSGSNGFQRSFECRENDSQEDYTSKSEPNDWWRCLSISIVNMGFSTSSLSSSNIEVPCEEYPSSLHVLLRKPLWYHSTLVIRSCLSFIQTRLSYSDWALIWLVYEDNVGRKADSSTWDAVNDDPNFFWGEYENDELEQPHPRSLTYSDGARIIRYGIKKDLPSKHKKVSNENTGNNFDTEALKSDEETVLDLKLDLEGLKITLRRDDIPSTFSTPSPMIFDYDSSRVHVKRLEVEFKSTSKGDQHIMLTLFQLDWLDLGNVERLHRQAALGTVDSTALPSAFTIIAEGSIHSPVDDRIEPKPPQLAVSVFKPANGIPTASIVLNYLTINALVKPIVETIEFLSCSWHTAEVSSRKICSPSNDEVAFESDGKQDIGCESTKYSTVKESPNVEGFNVKLVAHYPQVFLLADEADPFSRALVFRGLAVVDYLTLRENVAFSSLEKTSYSSHYASEDAPEWKDIKCTRSLSAELHSMESYVNPDVSEVLGYNRSFHNGKKPPQLGIALIEPLTASLCLSESVRELFPTNRFAKIQIDELSTILSFGDVDLIEKVLRRWLEERRRSSKEHYASNQSISEHSIVPGPPSTDLLTMQSEKIACHSSWEKESNAPNIDSMGGNRFIETKCPSSQQLYDVVFNTDKLGLILRKKKSVVVVDKILLSDVTSCINTGDIVYAIAGIPLSSKTPFKMVAKNLESYPRPLKLTFLRPDCESLSKNLAKGESKYSSGNSDVSIRDRQLSTGSLLPTQEKLMLDQRNSSSFSISDTKNETFAASKASTSIAGIIGFTDAPALLSPSMVYSIQFLVGSANGLRFEQALQGCIAVVSGIDQTLFTSATSTYQNQAHHEGDSLGWKCYDSDIEVEHCSDLGVHRKLKSFTDSVSISEVKATLVSNNSIRLPRPGAVLLAINGLKTAGLDFQTIMERLHGAATASDKNLSSIYTLSFAEIPASEWCFLDKITLDIKSLSLTVIDDINGRDMPLMQASTEKLQFCLDQGLGLPTQMIAVCPPSIFNLDSAFPCSIKRPSQSSSYGKAPVVIKCSDASEVIMKACVESTIGVEYYNPRLALWEPLLEPCRLRCAIERQAGNVKTEPPRPGHISVFISDGENIVDRKKKFPIGILDGTASINLTDAAAEVLFTAVSDWHRRRISLMSLHALMNDDVDGAVKETIGMTCSINATAMLNACATENSFSSKEVGLKASISNRRKATHEVALVAVEVAKKREGESNGGVAKPFIFRNRTGVSLKFHLQDSTEVKRLVENNSELRFNIDLFDNCKAKSGRSINSSLVRSYGQVQQFLCVTLDPTIGFSDLLTDLPVMKVGQYFRTLRNERRSILLSWTVDISDNRRVLTLSGSIWVNSLISGVSVEVGVKINTLNSDSEKNRESSLEENHEVFRVGTARPGSPCFLPIWLFQYDAVSVHVRPINRFLEAHSAKESLYDWSTSSLLEYCYSSRSWKPTQKKGNKAKTVMCPPINADFLPSFLHYSLDAYAPFIKDNAAMSNDVSMKTIPEEGIEASSMMIEVKIASTLTIRNLLPMAIEWEVIGYELMLKETNQSTLLDGSALRAKQKCNHGNTDGSLITDKNSCTHKVGTLAPCMLESGQAVDVLSCESQEMSPMARYVHSLFTYLSRTILSNLHT